MNTCDYCHAVHVGPCMWDRIVVTIEYVGGACPTQGWGGIGPLRWYFRARHGSWTLSVGVGEDVFSAGILTYVDSATAIWNAEGEDETNGWMDREDARSLILATLDRYARTVAPP